ncbi:MAG: hypothetical protein ACK5NN_05095 [Sphingomonadaceae bacterium]
MRSRTLVPISALAMAVMACSPASADSQKRETEPASAANQKNAPKQYAPKQRNYPKAAWAMDSDGRFAPDWTKTGKHDWRAVPDDPASPRYFEVLKSSSDPAAALRDISQQAGISIRDTSTREIETYSKFEGSGKGYVTAGSATVGGVEHSVIVTTGYEKALGGYSSSLTSIPTDTYRKWGGVLYFMDFMGLTVDFRPHMPEGMAEQIPNANNADQAEFFAGLIDLTTNFRIARAAQARAGAGSAGRSFGKSMRDSAECHQLSYCNYNWMTGESDYNGD